MRIRIALVSLTMVLTGLVGSTFAATAWDESINGDLSTNPAAPTAVSFGAGSNIVTGTVTNSGSPVDNRDFLTFTIGPGQGLYGLKLLQWDDVPGPGDGNTGFNAIHPGASSEVPAAGTIGNFLGSNHVDGSYVGRNMLPDIAAPATGGTGFTIPLGPGTYTYHVQQTGPQKDAYSLDFRVRVVPEPTALILACLGLAGVCGLRRR